MSNNKSPITFPRNVAANRENARKSTGPRSPRVRRTSASLRQSRYVKSLSYDQAKLGESPEDFMEFLAELIEDWQPVGAMEMTLVEDLATLEMERRLVDRAQRARLVKRLEREEAKVSRNARLLEENATANVTREDVVANGLRNSPDCPGKFREMIDMIEPLLACIKLGDFSCPPDEIFSALYGDHPSWRAAQIISLYSKFVQRYADDPQAFPVSYTPKSFSISQDDLTTALAFESDSAILSAGASYRESSDSEDCASDGPTPWGEAKSAPGELRSDTENEYRTLHHLMLEEYDATLNGYRDFRRDQADLSRARRDSLLAPNGSPSALMIRQKNSIDRHFERKIKLLMLLQKERRARRGRPPKPCGPRTRRHSNKSRLKRRSTLPRGKAKLETRMAAQPASPLQKKDQNSNPANFASIFEFPISLFRFSAVGPIRSTLAYAACAVIFLLGMILAWPRPAISASPGTASSAGGVARRVRMGRVHPWGKSAAFARDVRSNSHGAWPTTGRKERQPHRSRGNRSRQHPSTTKR